MFLVHFALVQQHISIYFDLNCQDGDLVCRDLQLVWLAVEAKAIDWFKRKLFLRLVLLNLGSNECELNIRIEVSREVLEWELELLDTLCLLYCEGN